MIGNTRWWESRSFAAFLKVFSMLSVLFALFYAGFQLLSPWIQTSYHPPDPETLTPWAKHFANEIDGREMPVMTALFSLYLLAALAIALNAHRLPWLPGTAARVVLCLPALWIVAATRSWNFTPIPIGKVSIHLALLGGLAAAAAAFKVYEVLKQAGGMRPKLFIASFWAGFALFILSTTPPPSVIDYAFFLGPAGKILNGETWGSFFQQYGLGETLLFAGMMGLGMPLFWMQVLLSMTFVAWVFMYHRLARRLFDNQSLALLFLMALIVIRISALSYCPFNSPQTTPLRMDIWVPLLLAWAIFGISSPVTAVAFGVAYLLDNIFGFLFCGSYVAVVLGGKLAGHPDLAPVKPVRIALLALPAVLACFFQLLIYGSPISPAGKLYQDLNLGFMTIDPHSLFWPVAFLLALCLPLLARGGRLLHLFLFPVAVIQLIYFFGRSHENNLLNVSGIFILIFFLALDRLAGRLGRPVLSYALSAVLIGSSVFLFEEGIWSRTGQLRRNLAGHALILRAEEEGWADEDVDIAQRFPGRNIVFVSPFDTYLYYRYRLPPPEGFWTPFMSRFYLDETALYLRDRVLAGDAVLVGSWYEPLTPLENSPKLLASGWRLVVKRENGENVYGLEPASP